MKLYVIVKVLCSFVLGVCYFGSPSVERFRCSEGSYRGLPVFIPY